MGAVEYAQDLPRAVQGLHPSFVAASSVRLDTLTTPYPDRALDWNTLAHFKSHHRVVSPESQEYSGEFDM